MIKKDLIEDKQSMGGELYDYHVYDMKLKDRLIAFAIGFIGAAVVMEIFFGVIIVDVIVGVVAGIIAQKIYRNMMIERIRDQLTLQFKDMLDSLNSSVSAGKVIVASFLDAQNDMKLQYGETSHIYKELDTINIGLMNGVNIEDLIGDFGRRSGIEDIQNFANVFLISNRRGGNIKTIISESRSIICDKIEIEQEIKTMSSSTKSELNIMMLMPIIIVPMISSFSQDGSDETVNILVKIAGLAIFIIAYIIGTKIVKIKI